MGSSDSVLPRSAPPLLGFHRIHGRHVQVAANWRSAKRLQSYNHAVLLSNRPINLAEYIHLRIVDTVPRWRGVMRLGVTTHHPGTMSGKDLPPTACPDLISATSGYWLKSLPDSWTIKGGGLYFHVSQAGQMLCGQLTLQGRRQEEQELLAGLDTSKPLWMVIDLYGQTSHIEFIEPSQKETYYNNRKRAKNTSSSSGLFTVDTPEMENAQNEALLARPASPPSRASHHSLTVGVYPVLDQDLVEEILHPVGTPGQRHSPVDGSSDSGQTVSSLSPLGSGRSGEDNIGSTMAGVNQVAGQEQLAECIVCFDGQVNCAIYKCGHMCLCYSCATELKDQGSQCPLCRQPITDVIKTYQTTA